MTIKNGQTIIFFSSILLLLDPGCKMGKNSGSEINVPDPERWVKNHFSTVVKSVNGSIFKRSYPNQFKIIGTVDT